MELNGAGTGWVRSWERSAGDLMGRITHAAAAYAIERSAFYRDNLARAMRRAMDAGLGREQVIALSVLPREEAERLVP